MFVIRARNVNDAWYWAKKELAQHHVVRPSRVGEVWEHPEPVATFYEKPLERVLFDPQRDANPFFHLMESLWMLAGRNDIKWLLQFNKRMAEFSDDGVTQHGAYGHRWRNHFFTEDPDDPSTFDQLEKIIAMLKRNPDERRAVLEMWDPSVDLDQPKRKDVPCNTSAYFKIRQGKMCMVVSCRSNDIIWGCYGANAVHFSFLLEYVAGMVGVPVGTYTQISDSWHAYTERWEKYVSKFDPPRWDPYDGEGARDTYPLIADPYAFDIELLCWIAQTETPDLHERGYTNGFFPRVAQPLFNAWQHYKQRDWERALDQIERCEAGDWRMAAKQWVERRYAKTMGEAVGV